MVSPKQTKPQELVQLKKINKLKGSKDTVEVRVAALSSLHTRMLGVSWLKMKASGILFHASLSGDFSYLNFA